MGRHLCNRRWIVVAAAGALAALGAAVPAGVTGSDAAAGRGKADRPPVDFARDVRPILEARCVECHGGRKKRGGLRLDTPAGLRSGGSTGALFAAGKPDESLLIRCVLGVGDAPRMPPKGERLSDEQIAVLTAWVRQGAELPAGGAKPATKTPTADDDDGRWALRPIARPKVPEPPADRAGWVRTPIDAFVLARLTANGLGPSPEADKRLLARRVAIDLTGLPPTPEELDAHLADAAADAYERWVDRLLASPRYGERWARHWLDVAHYADSHGQDQDRFRPNAWPYRDYLIRSFNADKPYARFVREQIAGDALYPGDPDALVATGFLAAGPWDESGLRDINDNSPDRLAAQYLDRDDIVTSVMTTFNGLTVHCARCHDHKFDPVTQADYYALQAVFAATDKGDRPYDPDPAVAARRAELTAALERLNNPDAPDAALSTPEIDAEAAKLEAERRDAGRLWIVPAPTEPASKNGATLTVLPDRSVLSGGTAPDRDTYTVALPIEGPGITGLRLEVLCDDSLPHRGPGRQPNGNLHLSEIRVRVHPAGKPEQVAAVKIKAAAADFDQAGWAIRRAFDGDPTTAWGIYPEVGKPHETVFEFAKPVGFEGGGTLLVELDQLHGGTHLIGRFRLSMTTAEPLGPKLRPLPAGIAAALAVPAGRRTDRQRRELSRRLAERRLQRELEALPPQARVYCGSNKFTPDGRFRPTPKPRPVHVLHRGEPSKPGDPASPGAVAAVPGPSARFELTHPEDDGARRAALAEWLGHRDHPLTWRVIVNRMWHHHFGRGIVDTPNDFGKMGGRPSHPELLDWLAAEFRDGGGSLKRLHRMMVTSSTYRQAVRHDPAAAARDADNRLLWRAGRGRLDAETLRDAVLQAAGRLDLSMYGPPVQHFVASPGLHVTPKADYDAFDVDSPAARRRSVYRFVFRTCPDPMNRRYADAHPGDSRLTARVESYELAARMQLAAPEAFDLSREPEAVRTAYGVDRPAAEGAFSRNCLLARRLAERGVRFVQVWSGAGGPSNNWDNHVSIPKELPPIAKQVVQPVAALLADLKARGLMSDTLVVFTTEFGRMPFTQGGVGRDHNGGTFVTWLAGAGIKGGVAHGESDEFSYRAARDRSTCYDLHATILHLMGVDHERLSVRHNGIDRRLTDVHGHVIEAVLA